MKFVLATANLGKVEEMRSILSGLDIDVISRHELGIKDDIEETGDTFAENALIKAEAICKVSGLPAIADDSGLVVDALGGEPGVHSSSYGGPALSGAQRCAYLLEKLRNKEQRSAKFVCTIVCAFPDGKNLISEGECNGEIAMTPRGSGGFGYDPVFLIKSTGKTMAELSAEEKNAVSHRGEALRKFILLLQERGYR
ncbi:MAG: XTP/dITP diphosphatase [Oscillospiraceae bacterium]|nr:XTP/dITP diphosphatase [Oscillospiraceae bacterium]